MMNCGGGTPSRARFAAIATLKSPTDPQTPCEAQGRQSRIRGYPPSFDTSDESQRLSQSQETAIQPSGTHIKTEQPFGEQL